MPLKNYTSQVAAEKSIMFIERTLAAHGVTDINKRYDDQQRVTAIMFIIPVNGQDMAFKLPARVSECERVLEGMLSRRAQPETRKKIPAQAQRTSWKIVADWVEAQMAMIELAQVEIMEVFLPYLYDNRTEQTLFETVKERGYKGLLTG